MRKLRMVYAWQLVSVNQVYAWFTHGLRLVYAWFNHGLRMVYARFTHGQCNVNAWFTQATHVYACWFICKQRLKHDWDVYAIPRNPHLKTSSRGAEAPTCPETSPWPTRSYAIAWFRRLYLEQSQPSKERAFANEGVRIAQDLQR